MGENNKQLWDAVLGELELNLTKASFTTWFKNTFIIENREGRVIVGVPNTFSQAWLKQKYHQHIYKSLQDKVAGRIKEVIYKVQQLEDYKKQVDSLKKTLEEATPSQVAQPTITEYKISEPTKKEIKFGALNPRYTFDNFVIGKANELATAAAKGVAEKPGLVYNPLFLYGGVGLGKTHLMQAVGHEILKKDPTKKILYVTCEQFTKDFIKAIQTAKTDYFENVYRSPDVWLIDDIQFLSGKEGTQEAFFHTFNDLHQRDKQIIITSDRPPKALATLEDRMISRFEWGMIADISQPDLETRTAILATKCREKNFELDKDIIQYITLNIQNNIRELEGALNKIIAYYQLNKIPPSIENVKKILFSISAAGRQTEAVSAAQLIEIVGGYYSLVLEDILGKSRQKRLAFPRQIIMFLLREELNLSYPAIGAELGGRDHTTAMHAYNKILKDIEKDEKLRQEINIIKQKIYNY